MYARGSTKPHHYEGSHGRRADGNEEDGRRITEIPALPGALCYGNSTNEEAARGAEALALGILADPVASSFPTVTDISR
jgi:hypothetical protein